MENENYIDTNLITKQVLEIGQAADAGNIMPDIKGNGIALLKSFSSGITKNGNRKFTGILVNKAEVKFNVWNNSAAFRFLEELAPNTAMLVVSVSYTVSKYGFVLDSLETVNGYDPNDFIIHKYEIDDQIYEFEQALEDCKASEKAIFIIKAILHLDECDDIFERFVNEYAALVHHDNCSGGLLAHINKCLNIYDGIKSKYDFLSDEITNDLMVIGIALHDIGKIFEMHNGVYREYSFITHRGLGFEYLISFKDLIVCAYSEEIFYMISSIILQHHGEYGENPKTLYALLVHKIDEMEAALTEIEETLENNISITDSAGTKIKLNDSYFNIINTN